MGRREARRSEAEECRAPGGREGGRSSNEAKRGGGREQAGIPNAPPGAVSILLLRLAMAGIREADTYSAIMASDMYSRMCSMCGSSENTVRSSNIIRDGKCGNARRSPAL